VFQTRSGQPLHAERIPTFCASVVYPADAVGFDFEYFATIHAPMFAGILGTNCERFEVHRPLASPSAPQPPFACAAYFWVRDPQAFGAALAEYGDRMYADIANFSQVAAGSWVE
jgi:uncharacterized protein (TIGR02118 family)